MRISTNKWLVLVFVAGLAISLVVWYVTGHAVFLILLLPPLLFGFGKRQPAGNPTDGNS